MIVKRILLSIGKGLWWFCKAVGREINRSYQRYKEQQKWRAIREDELGDIEEENRASGRGWARGQADVREEEIIRRQNERDQRDYDRGMNRIYKFRPVNNKAFFGSPKKRKRSK